VTCENVCYGRPTSSNTSVRTTNSYISPQLPSEEAEPVYEDLDKFIILPDTGNTLPDSNINMSSTTVPDDNNNQQQQQQLDHLTYNYAAV